MVALEVEGGKLELLVRKDNHGQCGWQLQQQCICSTQLQTEHSATCKTEPQWACKG